MIKVVCFDLFSTLVDVSSVPISVGRMTADILGIEKDQWNALCFSEHHEICRPTEAIDVIRSLIHSYDASVSEEQILQASIERQNRFDYALKKHIQVDVLEGINSLKQRGYDLILVSNASSAEVQAWPESPLAKYFDHSVFSYAVGLKKPDAAIYEYVCQLAAAEPSECLFVGDGGSDELIGAKAAGMPTLLMTRFMKKKNAACRKAYVDVIDAEVNSTSAVLDWIGQQ
ncbi:HAD family hydrolase [Beggiatoa alba]|nr:HAD family hydrolase [Beggiatoa alba]